MSVNSRISAAVYDDPMRVFGHQDPTNSMVTHANRQDFNPIMKGIVTQFNIGLYSAKVQAKTGTFICSLGTQNVVPGFGYSDANILREGDMVLFAVLDQHGAQGVILAREPQQYAKDSQHNEDVKSKTKLERRTNLFSDYCYRKKSSTYSTPQTDNKDLSTIVYTNNRPTDLVPGELALLNQHRCGILGNMYSASIVGGGAHIKIFSLENRIRTVADSIIKYTMNGNDCEWHNRRYLSRERTGCLYQEERLGLKQKSQPAFEKADYDDEKYFNKNKKERQTANYRLMEHEGYYGNIYSKYVMQRDPDIASERTMDTQVKAPGVVRESIDPSGQYRLATAGMMSFERTGRIPVPTRIKYPWQKESEEPKATELKEFEHNKAHPFYRQLELADRAAYDLKNSYARLDEEDKEFYVPEESDLKDKLKDTYDKGFTESKTVKLEKYDKRRSGIWQGEDGSIIFRDAWGSEIVMIGGNIQLSCAGNVEIMPAKTAMTLAGDDIVQKAQNSIDIESADKDVRINAFKNVQVMAGADDSNPGGIILEAQGDAYPWDAKSADGGEQVQTTGILLKSKKGTVATDAKTTVIRGRENIQVLAGEEDLDGTIQVSSDSLNVRGERIVALTEKTALLLDGGAGTLVGDSILVAGSSSATRISGGKFPIPIMMVPVSDVASDVLSSLKPVYKMLKKESVVSYGYKIEDLDKMIFKFRSSQECGTDKSWEIDGGSRFTLYQPFWHQVRTKFETLKSVNPKKFEDHKSVWDSTDAKNPWPGTEALRSGKYAKLSSESPQNMDSDGSNKSRKSMQNSASVTEEELSTGYQIRQQ